MLASDFSRLRQVRSPECGSPDTSSTRSLSRTPSIATTARLLTSVSSFSSGEASISTMFGAGMLDVDLDVGSLAADEIALADHLAVAADDDLCALAGDALVVEPVGDGLRLADDAEPRRRR